jgi:transketolase
MTPRAVREKADSLRQYICEMCLRAESGHPCSSLSTADILATLFFSEMNFCAGGDRASNDVFILSKGHAAPALYAALMLQGTIPRELVGQLRRLDSPLQGHPDVTRLPEVDATTGALGQGLSMAIGRALGIQQRKQRRHVYCLVGDGESQEGQVWEAAQFGGNRALPNLIVFTDHNKGQSDGPLADIMPVRNLPARWAAFGWHVLEIDGHSVEDIQLAIRTAKGKADQRPTMIIANTVKGYVSPELVILGGSHEGKITEQVYQTVTTHLGGRAC